MVSSDQKLLSAQDLNSKKFSSAITIEQSSKKAQISQTADIFQAAKKVLEKRRDVEMSKKKGKYVIDKNSLII